MVSLSFMMTTPNENPDDILIDNAKWAGHANDKPDDSIRGKSQMTI
jgi:hypothetical protein